MMVYSFVVFSRDEDSESFVATYVIQERLYQDALDVLKDKVGHLCEASDFYRGCMFAHFIQGTKVNTEGLPVFQLFPTVPEVSYVT